MLRRIHRTPRRAPLGEARLADVTALAGPFRSPEWTSNVPNRQDHRPGSLEACRIHDGGIAWGTWPLADLGCIAASAFRPGESGNWTDIPPGWGPPQRSRRKVAERVAVW